MPEIFDIALTNTPDTLVSMQTLDTLGSDNFPQQYTKQNYPDTEYLITLKIQVCNKVQRTQTQQARTEYNRLKVLEVTCKLKENINCDPTRQKNISTPPTITDHAIKYTAEDKTNATVNVLEEQFSPNTDVKNSAFTRGTTHSVNNYLQKGAQVEFELIMVHKLTEITKFATK
ncbi:hypothetical protein PR048_013949 [Dryococelus australis]|uniref:Uncharacterized protein n=1 Tax=Dryococelus australis TaxID=614101 RepID=A0ABQ9HTM8_9NEOP|nr:hypothetical protein PR048_013949 [Dryococelus australis]